MSFLALLVALLVEQMWPSSFHRKPAQKMRELAGRIAGGAHMLERSERVLWWVTVPGMALAAALAYGLLAGWAWMLGLAFSVVLLYLLLGYRSESRCFGDIHLALGTGDLGRARALLGGWRGGDPSHACAAEVARLSVEHGLVRAHRLIFGMAFWLWVLPGPSGAVFYRMAEEMARDAPDDAFARRAFELVDWLPARISALAFAIFGNFEDALYCWRTQAALWQDRASGILISSGAGALGVRLGLPIHDGERVIERPELGTGGKADVTTMQAAAKLAWRSLVLVLLVLALLGIAGWAGD
jgi:adenosylcobinamide-phosphate synthase